MTNCLCEEVRLIIASDGGFKTCPVLMSSQSTGVSKSTNFCKQGSFKHTQLLEMDPSGAGKVAWCPMAVFMEDF